MAKLMCKKCGGKVKMATGGVTPSKAIPRASMGLNFGIPQTGTTNYSAPTMKKGGAMNSLPKAKLGTIVKGAKAIAKFFGPAIGATGKSSKLIKPAAKTVKSTINTKHQVKEIGKIFGKAGLLMAPAYTAAIIEGNKMEKDKANKNKVAVNKNKVKVNANKVKVNANKQ